MQPVYSEFVEFLDSHGCDTSWYKDGQLLSVFIQYSCNKEILLLSISFK